MEQSTFQKFRKISDVVWELPAGFKEGMNVPARIYATENLLKGMDEMVVNQVTNVACLPGIQKFSFCMPDGHSGYGFPIGGVAAFDPNEGGVISPGGIGFDINCGMRLIKTNLTVKEVQPKIKTLVDTLFKMVPAGVGATSFTEADGFIRLNKAQFVDVISEGVPWCVENGYAWKQDLDRIEEYGKIAGADPDTVSDSAIKRGINQLGTLGSGNHYLEVQLVGAKEIYDPEIAKKLGIFKDQVVVMVHCGSRGFGHQVATDYLKTFLSTMPKYGLKVLDRELACAPFNSPEAQKYYKAMACAANMAFANRQVIVYQIRKAFEKVFGQSAESLGMEIVYDVAHNIAKVEKHKVDGKTKELVVHRKGATRCFGPGREELPKLFKELGQPVIVGGSMETGSYLLVGTKKAEEETFGSTMHGSGRTMSRTHAKRIVRGDQLQKDMEAHGIYVKAVSMPGLAEEAGLAYKNISEVVGTVEKAGLSKPVVALRPIGNVKG